MAEIDRLDSSQISYIDWFCDYLLPNRPCIFTPKLTEDWNARKDWRKSDAEPDIDFLISRFGEADVPVVDTRQTSGYDSLTQTTMKLKCFLTDHFIFSDETGVYLKDWHFVKEFPSYEAYQLTPYFRNDWMNEYWDSKNDSVESDYRFVYIGGPGTWTPFHADVFRSHSWSANVCGQKRWFLVRPGIEKEKIEKYWKEEHAGDSAGTNMTDIRAVLERHPELYNNGDVLEVVQEAGEVIFVPSNWHHQVHNLGSVISINHNWCNGANIERMWLYLIDRLEAVKKELSDCRSLMNPSEWFQQCQVVLKCDIGMDFRELLSMLDLIIKYRVQHLQFQITPLPKTVFTCDVCSASLVRCHRTPECLHAQKSKLKSACTCSVGLKAEECDFCIRFFAMFDISACVLVMESIVASEDASALPDIPPFWRSRLADIRCLMDSFMT